MDNITTMENRRALIIAGLVLFGGLFLVIVFTVINIMVGDDDLERNGDEANIEEIVGSETPTPTVYLSPTLAQTQNAAAPTTQALTNPTLTTPATQVAQPATAADCVPRTDLPTYTVQQGDILSSIAEAAGITTDELATYNCLLNEDQLVVGQTLYVPNIATVAPTVAPTAAVTIAAQAGVGGSTAADVCENEWFFAFDQGQADLLNACPDPVTTVNAVGQNFQNGRIYVYAAPPITPDTRGIGFVIYNDGTWEAYRDTWEETALAVDPNITPPEGLFQPTEAVGKIWRENPELQNKLGWAIEPPAPFVGRTQLPSVASPYFYIDHGVEGYVLRLTTSAEALNTWELVGSYTPTP